MRKLEFHITDGDAGKRIDLQASEISGITRSQIQRFIEKGLLSVNNLVIKPNYRTKPGDVIYITIPDETPGLVPEDIPVEIIYMDDSVVVVNKPPGLVVYPAAGHRSGTLMNAIAFHCGKLASIGAPLRPGVVHRLDKDTSGVMVVTVENGAYYSLIDQFKERTITRRYIAILYGNMEKDRGEISLRIGRSESDRKKMSTKARRGKEAVTAWNVIERFNGATLVEAKLGTGRTHQIRVHFASVGHPVLGDEVYGRKTCLERKNKKIKFPRQMLHAELLGFSHPATGRYIEFKSALPRDMEEGIEKLRENL